VITHFFGNSNVNAQVIANLPQFYADAAQSTWFDMLLEYGSVNGANGTNQSIGWGKARSFNLTSHREKTNIGAQSRVA
jgi:hypothetical protein